MVRCSLQTVIFLLWFLCGGLLNQSLCSKNSKIATCNERDREILMQFKNSLIDPSNLLSSWSTDEDCCKWSGVQCHNITGRVTKLNLKSSYIDPNYTAEMLTGEINLCVLELEFLNDLDLSWNNFTTIYDSTPSRLHLPVYSSLQHLDFSVNTYLQMENLRWISHTPFLKYLDLSYTDLHIATDWLHSLTTMLPFLSELWLCDCSLSHINASLEYVNFTSLTMLDLRWNKFYSKIPNWVFNLSDSLSHLDLRWNKFYGQIPSTLSNLPNLKSLLLSYNELNGTIPEQFGQCKSLQELDLSHNSFLGPIPPTLGNISSLALLDLSFNQLNGSLPESIGQLSNLETLEVRHNSFIGVLSEVHFAKLSNLKLLDLSFSAFLLRLGSKWVPPFQVQNLYLSSCILGPNFPAWLYTQNSLIDLDLSDTGISSIDHQDKFWNFISNNIIESVDLSNNSISGDISNRVLKSHFINLSSNNISGGLPRLAPNVSYFLIGNNSFSGSTHSILCDAAINRSTVYLDMSHNHLSGELADCWIKWQLLSFIYLGGNNLIGKIPHSMGSLSSLQALSLPSNNLFGEVPLTLQNCKYLELLDLAENKFSGSIPSWMGQNMGAVKLRSNQFTGNIPSQICQISFLIVLDLADNRLSGPIPKCLHNISVMHNDSLLVGTGFTAFRTNGLYELRVTVLNKGREMEYQKNLHYVRLVDLSSNSLSGPIPPELFGLSQLNIFNLSNNKLVGRLPHEIGNMKSLESLDLSRNQLSGEIPQTISDLSFLSYLNLSYNNFTGKIPLTTQLQSFSALSYVGNPELCGPPLTKKCSQQEGTDETNHNGEDDNQSEVLSHFYTGMGVGFAIGFWGVCATIFFNRACRHAYFRFLDQIKDGLISWCS